MWFLLEGAGCIVELFAMIKIGADSPCGGREQVHTYRSEMLWGDKKRFYSSRVNQTRRSRGPSLSGCLQPRSKVSHSQSKVLREEQIRLHVDIFPERVRNGGAGGLGPGKKRSRNSIRAGALVVCFMLFRPCVLCKRTVHFLAPGVLAQAGAQQKNNVAWWVDVSL